MTKHIIALLATLTIAACSKGSPVTRPAQLVAVPAAKATGFKLDLGTCTDTKAVIAAEQRGVDRVEVDWVRADSAAAQAVATPKLALASTPATLALASNSCSL